MKRIMRSAYSLLKLFGVDPLKTYNALRGLPSYCRDYIALKKQRHTSVHEFPFAKLYPCLDDRFTDSGSANGHYFHQDLLVARRIFRNQPQRHVDVGSRIDGFVAHVAVFRAIEVIDIRPLANNIPNVTFMQADLINPVDAKFIGYCDSLSCLHAMEHFGLGRYGDQVFYDGYVLGMDNLHRMLKPGGTLYFSVPIGPQRIEFNAHRVFSVAYLLKCFAGKYRLVQFSWVDDQGDLHENVAINDDTANNSFGCYYGCGIFELTKL